MRKRLFVIAALGLLAVFGGRLALLFDAAGTPDAAQAGQVGPVSSGTHRAAIVFGAGLQRDGQPSLLLRDRVRAAAKLIQHRTVDVLLMTGDNSRQGYSEPSAMRTLAMSLGVKEDQIAVDYGGRRTWDSCERASNVFAVRRAIVVSNDFHRARTVALCKAAGIAVDGAVGTSTAGYRTGDRGNWEARELIASWRGVGNAWIHHPGVPVGGRRIDIYDPCSVWESFSPSDRASTPEPASCPHAVPVAGA